VLSIKTGYGSAQAGLKKDMVVLEIDGLAVGDLPFIKNQKAWELYDTYFIGPQASVLKPRVEDATLEITRNFPMGFTAALATRQ